MTTLKIKALSVNGAWQGRRFKTPEYKAFEEEMLLRLPRLIIPQDKQLHLYLEVGVSSSLADLDNTIKPILDVLQKKYQFNDKAIYEIQAVKLIVPKKQEYIKFELSVLNP